MAKELNTSQSQKHKCSINIRKNCPTILTTLTTRKTLIKTTPQFHLTQVRMAVKVKTILGMDAGK